MIPSDDTKATLLLCGRFSKEGAKPLTPTEYNTLAKWLHGEGLRPSALLESSFPYDSLGLDTTRLRSLLGRGVALTLQIETWASLGIRALGRSDRDYPERWREVLKGAAPPIVYAAGPASPLGQRAVVIVGARDATEDGLEAARRLGAACARLGWAVASGNARGVDRLAMQAALDGGGHAIGVLSDGLSKAVLDPGAREAMETGRLLLLSVADPQAHFQVGLAMERNKFVYALGQAAAILDAKTSGGTWEGAKENHRKGLIPGWVRMSGAVLPGNVALHEMGLKAMPKDVADWLPLLDAQTPVEAVVDEPDEAVSPTASSPAEALYHAFLAALIDVLATQPTSSSDIGETLDLVPKQLKLWLDRAFDEGRIKKERRGRQQVFVLPEPSLLPPP